MHVAVRLITIGATLCLVLLSNGCATLARADGSEGAVTLTSDGHIYVGDTYTGLADMTRRLKAKGLTRSSRIVVEIPHNTAPEAMQQIGRQLHAGGFPRFVFVKPRQAVSAVGEDPFVKRFREGRQQGTR